MSHSWSARAREHLERARDYYDSLSSTSRLVFWIWVGLHVLTTAFIIYVTPAQLFAWMAEWAEGLRDMGTSGRLLLFSLIVLTSFPPLFGYGTSITLCGFAFGTLEGWLLAASGCVVGGVLSFLVTRRMIGWFAPMLSREPTFVALGRAVRVKGLPLVILIRLCPFPFPYSNAFFASIETVSTLQFVLATLCITPKLALHVWIGARMFLFADPETRNKMDPQAKLVNIVFVVVGTGLGVATSWYLYRLTMRYVSAGNGLGEGEDIVDLEHGGLMQDVDEMLEEEEEEGRGEQGMTRSNGAAPHTRKASVVEARRMSRMAVGDDWEGSFSDFGDDHPPTSAIRASEDGVDEEDLWGLNEEGEELETIEEADALNMSHERR